MIPDERASILVVDDERLNRNLLAELLRHEYRVLLAKDGPGALRLARQEAGQQPSLILLDVSMPGMDGYQVIRHLKADDHTAHIPVMFITAQDEVADEELGLQLGAADYIHKPIRPAIVSARVRNLVNLARQKQALQQMAHHDGLTGLANRRLFDQALERACRRAARSQIPIGVAMIDIDHFKQYNDRFGHLRGDEALRSVADALARHANRPDDLAARYGGEEFVLLSPLGIGIQQQIEQFRHDVMNLGIPHPLSSTAPVLTVSCGVVLTLADQSTTPTDLLRIADEKLYEAKSNGRNRMMLAEIGLVS